MEVRTFPETPSEDCLALHWFTLGHMIFQKLILVSREMSCIVWFRNQAYTNWLGKQHGIDYL